MLAEVTGGTADRDYRSETTIYEKLHAMVVLDARNSRMRDFFDVHALAARKAFAGGALLAAVVATFGRRGTPLPLDPPLALTPGFAAVEGKETQRKGFVRRLPGTTAPLELQTVIERVAAFVGPVLIAAARGESLDRNWAPVGRGNERVAVQAAQLLVWVVVGGKLQQTGWRNADPDSDMLH